MAGPKPNAKTQPAKTGAPIADSNERNVMQTLTLPSGAVCEIMRFKGKHVQQASRLIGDDPSKMDVALASILCRIDGKVIVMEDFGEMDGMDYLKIMKPINELFM